LDTARERRARWRCTVPILATLLAAPIGGTSASAAQAAPAECRSGATPAPAPVETVLPDGDPFAPPIAGAGEPRISLGYVRTRRSGTAAASGDGPRDFTAGVVSAGAVFGLWARALDCDTVQVSLLGGVFAQFHMDDPSQSLINSDFLIGGQMTHRRGPVSARLRVYHQSSHLGDEFLLRNPRVTRVNFGFQAVDGLVSFDRDVWRVYAGGGAHFFSHDNLSPGVLRAGVEVSQRPTRGRRPRLVGALDVTAHQALDWRRATSGAGGLEWSGSSNTRRLRALVVVFSGPTPWGQFFDEEMRHAGGQFQFEF
jgi:hypothetical protein